MNQIKINTQEQRQQIFEKNIALKYQIFNGLFLGLPFKNIDEAGARLSIFAKRCEQELAQDKSPLEIVESYLSQLMIPDERKFELLFKFLQFIERQVVLFDALEDAAFSQINNLSGQGSVDYLINQAVHSENNKLEELSGILEYYKVRIALTAHPTQFYPKHILAIIAEMGEAIRNNQLDLIHDLFLQMGFSRFSNKTKPTPIDEAKSLIWYLEKVFYINLPKIQQKLPTSNVNLDIGFWPGGDRDGNPFVTAEVTLEVAKQLNYSIIRLYLKDLHHIRHRLTFAGIHDNLLSIISQLESNNFSNSIELVQALEQIVIILNNQYQSLFVNLVDELILKVKMFGFNFVKLDIRQNSSIHKQAINNLFKVNLIHEDYISLSFENQVDLLQANMTNLTLLENIHDDITKEVIDTVTAIYKIQKDNGFQAIERYIISNTSSAINVFEVLFLINLVNTQLNLVMQVPSENLIKVEVVPLFEMIDDLKNAKNIMDYLYSHPLYKNHLVQQRFRQTIMLGFSDGTKDGGYLMANWSIYLAKKQLTTLARKYEVDVIFFDGRGGPPARGGGNTNDFYHSLGKHIESNEIHLTIQGQTISSNFGTNDSALFNLEQLFTSGIAGKLFPEKIESMNNQQENLLQELAEICHQAYTDLRHHELFVAYLEEITPLKYLSEVNVGSRPAKRNKDSKLKLEDLRAIPFVSSWAQMKQNILGFYGVGTGIQTLINKNINYKTQLHNLYKESLFFKTLIDNAIQSLTKSNFQLTQYLKDDFKFGEFWQKLKDEAELTKQMLLLITNYKQLIGNDLVKLESIKTREKIILPLLIIQLYAMIKLRDKANENNKLLFEKLIKKSLAASINANRNSV